MKKIAIFFPLQTALTAGMEYTVSKKEPYPRVKIPGHTWMYLDEYPCTRGKLSEGKVRIDKLGPEYVPLIAFLKEHSITWVEL